MLEAERAGAKALVVLMDSFQRNSEHWTILRRVQADEAHNCSMIGEMLKRTGTPYSHATGAFYDKAIAVEGPRKRIEFLIRGLGWAVKEFEKALPRIGREDVRYLIQGMRERHRRSIAACEAIAKKPG